ncbi:MAG TPA: PQQ-binding-like beta-propeller repeat protein [Candidatus Aminicenantes bacterium]|nr:PQQ-binding-like beta-propeller repeat protein [Candidatus Aminicenantes bacterium]HRY63858.1 PQQ-binding-like beta-propeller repeat protein [Candidatus Aminicenantes bacterium]HRZ70771.1 PQQ-binding-like beta-propeller repeat protein [Candidatus Aminicenantes bacterium]
MKKLGPGASPFLAAVLLAGGLLAGASSGVSAGGDVRAGAGRAPLRFAWLSDTHVGSDRGADDLRASVADINTLPGLSFVLITGDVTEMGSYANLRLAKDILDGLRLPYHIIPGNHDTKWSESGGSDFARLWGADRFAFESGGFRFIGLSQGPVLRMGDGHWAPQDVRWLQGLLEDKGSAVEPTVFLSHYPLDDSIANWYAVLDKLKTVPTVAVLVGHGHKNQLLDFEGLRGVMGRANIGTKSAGPGYNLVEIGARAMTFAERTGRRTGAPWCRIELEKGGLPIVAAGWPVASAGARSGAGPGGKPKAPVRPDFGVNALYPQVKERWRFNAGWTIASSAAPAGETVIFADASGSVRALRVSDGSIVWEFKTDDPIFSTPEAGGGRVVFGGTDGAVYALDARLGTLAWKTVTGGPVVASPRIDGRTVYVGSGDHVFRAIDLATGRPVWSQNGIEGFVEAKPLVAGGMVVFGAWDSLLYGLDARTGQAVWTWRGEKPSLFYSPAACWPVAANGRVFAVAPDPWMIALELGSGRELWGTDNWAVRESIGVSADGQRVYVRTTENLMAAVSPSADGAEAVWETDAGFGADINSAMLVEKDGVVFYGTQNGLLLALDGATGAIKWKHRVGVALLNTVTPLSGREVVMTDFDGHVTLVSSDN